MTSAAMSGPAIIMMPDETGASSALMNGTASKLRLVYIDFFENTKILAVLLRAIPCISPRITSLKFRSSNINHRSPFTVIQSQ